MTAVDTPVTLTMPDALVGFLEDLDLAPDAQAAYDAGTPVPGSRYATRRITATVEVHRYLLERCWVLAGGPGVEATAGERRAYQLYRKHIDAAG